MKVLNSLNNCKKLSSCDTIPSFWLWECPTEIPFYLFLPILNLRQNSTNSYSTGICIQQKVTFRVRISQDRCTNHSTLQSIECYFAFIVPFKLDTMLSEPKNRFGNTWEILNEFPVIWAKTHKSSDFLNRCRSRPISDDRIFWWVSWYPCLRNNMSKKRNFLLKYFTLLGI